MTFSTGPGGSLSALTGASIGAGLGQGFSEGLQLLAQDRLKKMKEAQQFQRTTSGLKALGLSDQDAAAIARAPEIVQKQFFEESGLSRLFPGNTIQGGQAGALPTSQTTDTFSSGQTPGAAVEEGTQTVPQRTPSGIEALTESQLVELAARGGAGKRAADAERERRKALQEQTFKERQFSQKEKQFAFKETSGYRKEINDSFRNATTVNLRLGRLKQLSESGDLPHPVYAAALNALFDDPSPIISGDAVELEKLGLDLTAGLAKDFGNRINLSEFKTFLKRVPNLRQSTEGRRRIIRNMELIQVRPALLRGEAARAIIKENGGVPPLDLAEQVEDRVAPELDKIAEELNKGFAEANSEAQGEIGKTTEQRLSDRQKKKLRQKAGPGRVAVISPEGQEGSVPEAELDDYLKRNFIKL